MRSSTVSGFDKTRIPAGPWTPAVNALWDLFAPFFRNTTETLRAGVPVCRPLEVEILAGQTYPTQEYASPLPEGFTPTEVTVSNVVDPAFLGKDPGLTGGVTLPWTLGPGGGLVFLAATGLPSGARRIVRVMVYGQ